MKAHETNGDAWASFPPSAWGLRILADGRLAMEDVDLHAVAEHHGTPLHVLNIPRLRATAAAALQSVGEHCGSSARVHYAMKANNMPAIVAAMREAGLSVEVMTHFELRLALHAGYRGEEIIVNGPCKTEAFLHACCEHGVRLLVVDSLGELERLARIAATRECRVPLLLRINPDFTPRHMNRGTATASRTGSPFGLDLRGGEVREALRIVRKHPQLRFLGLHLHIGTGLRHADEHGRALRSLRALVREIAAMGFAVDVLDVGGGFGIPTSREFTSLEMLRAQATGRLPQHHPAKAAPNFDAFVAGVQQGVNALFGDAAPELIFEPGRSLVSDAQLLLLRVEYVKHRPGVGTWLITDGGLGTVTLPTWYEYHEVFPCAQVRRPVQGPVTITGPGCFAADVVYRNKRMPAIREGELLAVMDSGAYFLALESGFGHPRPAVAGVEGGTVRLLRRRETFEDMTARDFTH